MLRLCWSDRVFSNYVHPLFYVSCPYGNEMPFRLTSHTICHCLCLWHRERCSPQPLMLGAMSHGHLNKTMPAAFPSQSCTELSAVYLPSARLLMHLLSHLRKTPFWF